ncbi:1-deoxy-D-xylulose 5-phosphate reductoisomerase [Pyrinomonas methylaliphatogenes]|uniref:1-deoxy-D-xylulose 5-phosphate reductoisomerase n=1 Tax=Pyrinomonas methylaliphatogenes TaxID=454194 RepID=A0A0B6X270_9BACT|nr:1-deoxy-D-xylulose-5-phosphate reductoisomerase [Pyrinomonas methylaliphatogenes]CDM66634.1 1-deoxy-D-xylulose 5-phosphate reductoisomerase [Pyrinomonas methylaliphatogenes]
MKIKGIAILGSTGSIGCNTLRVIDSLGDPFRVVALAAKQNAAKLAEQVARYRPTLVSVASESCADDLRARLRELGAPAIPRIVVGEEGLIEVATCERASCVVSATVGAVGLVPTLRALEAGKRVALANKEALVMAGELMTRAAQKNGAELLPIDSEHNALHQCLRGETRAEVRRLILTASGGPFRNCNRAAMERATVEEAMRHPTWNMGAKVTIDSATLMNKGLEVIEAHWLFGFEADQISILIHPESVVHSMIELIDGSIIAQMGITDMRHAIQYALTYPQRLPSPLPRLDLARIGALHFEPPDTGRFRCLELAYRALRKGGTLPAVMNAANEEAVNAFLAGRIRLTDIARVVESVMDKHVQGPASALEKILKADAWARHAAASEIAALVAERGSVAPV